MKNILGKHYMGYKAVSAQVAFYGLSSALLPESDLYKNKQKFLEIFKTTQAEIPNIFSVWDECFSSARNYIKNLKVKLTLIFYIRLDSFKVSFTDRANKKSISPKSFFFPKVFLQ